MIALPTGVIGAPSPPCRMRKNTIASSDSAMPHSTVAAVKPMRQYSMTLRQPNFALSQPDIGVMIAVGAGMYLFFRRTGWLD